MKTYKYSDIALVPEFCKLISRSQADVTCQFAGRKWSLPVVPANMSCTIDFSLAEQMEAANYFYILHRFYDYSEILAWSSEFITKQKYLSLSVGVGDKDKQFVKDLAKELNFIKKTVLPEAKVDCLTIDIAHAHTAMVGAMIKFIKLYLPDTFVIAGNVATNKACSYLERMGADAVKVGIAPGKACSTYKHTGFGSIGMFTTIQDCADGLSIPLIADGGIRTNGDIVKAIVAGADMVMAGSIFAELHDSPAEIIYNYQSQFVQHGEDKPALIQTTPKYKYYFGSASEYQKGHNKHVEGEKIELNYNPMRYEDKLEEIKQDLQSAVSYAGGINLAAFGNTSYNIIC